MKNSISSADGIRHVSRFPNQLYRFFAIQSYILSLIFFGMILKKAAIFQGYESIPAISKAASDLKYTVSDLIRITESEYAGIWY